MTATKHTPGPWRYIRCSDEEFSHPGIEALNDTFSVVILGFKDDPNDDGGVRGRTAEEAEANAHLIAAAPDLLAFANRVDANLTAIHGSIEAHPGSQPDCYEWLKEAAAIWRECKAAIAKAEGRAE